MSHSLDSIYCDSCPRGGRIHDAVHKVTMPVLLLSISRNTKDRPDIRGSLGDYFTDGKIHLGIISECGDDIGVGEIGLFEDIGIRPIAFDDLAGL